MNHRLLPLKKSITAKHPFMFHYRLFADLLPACVTCSLLLVVHCCPTMSNFVQSSVNVVRCCPILYTFVKFLNNLVQDEASSAVICRSREWHEKNILSRWNPL
jgi:hypothetical protein